MGERSDGGLHSYPITPPNPWVMPQHSSCPAARGLLCLSGGAELGTGWGRAKPLPCTVIYSLAGEGVSLL